MSIDHETVFTSFAFSPDSDQIVVANSKGELIINKIGDHSEVQKRPTQASVILMKWFALATYDELGDVNPLLKGSAVDRFLPQIEAHKGSKEENIMKLNLYSSKPNSYSLLSSLDIDFRLALTLNGHFDLAILNLIPLLQANTTEGNPLVHDILFDRTKECFGVYHSEGGNIHKNMYLSLLSCPYLKTSRDTLVRVSLSISYLEEILVGLSHTFDSMGHSIKQIENVYVNPMYSYEDFLAKDDKFKGTTPNRDLLRIIRTGEFSTAFQKTLEDRFECYHQIADVNNVNQISSRKSPLSSATCKSC